MNSLTPSHDKISQLAQQEEIDLRQYWATINRHKWGIAGLAFVITLLTALVVFSMEPVYRATATLLIESQEANVVSIEEIYGLDTRNTEYYATQFEILKSRGLAEKVIDNLNLAQHPEFDPNQKTSRFNFDLRSWLPVGLFPIETNLTPPTAAEKKLKLVDEFLNRLTISPVRKTQLVKISFEAHDREMAANAANALADAYIESHLEARLEMTEKATVWLTERIDHLKTKVSDAERRLQNFREAENLIDLQGVRTLSSQEVQDLSVKLSALQERRSQLQNLVNQIGKLKGKPLVNLESIPAVLKHPVIQNLKSQEASIEGKKAEFGKRYGPQHPKMLAATSELNSVRNNMRQQIKLIIAGVDKEYEIARKNEASTERALEKAKSNVQKTIRKEFQLKELEREVDSSQKLYETFFTRFQETTATGGLKTVNARLMDPAVIPQASAKPKKGMSLAIAFAISIILGVLLAFLLEHLNNTFKGSDDIESRLGVAVLGLIPFAKVGRKETLNPLLIFKNKEFLALAESIRTIRTGLILSGLDNPHKVALVTSSIPSEGKTTISAGLAIALGQLEKVLLIDADMRRPSIARAFNLPENSPGLSELVAGTNSMEDTIYTQADAGIDVLPAGTIPPNPLELLSSAKFASVLLDLEKVYDRIIIDSAPAQAVSDPMVLSSHVNAVLYVIKADATQINIAKTGIKRLANNGAPITGVILNQLDTSKAAKYGNYNYYNGGYYGGYSSKENT